MRPKVQQLRWSTRRIAVLIVALSLPALSLAGAAVDPAASSALAAPVEPDPRPNVLFILTDDQRGGMSMMDATRKYFGAQGTRYANAMVTTPLCCPSRASIMTGRYAHNHGIRHNYSGPEVLHADMLQAELQAAGYRTGLFGKFLNAWPLVASPPYLDDFAVSRNGYQDRLWNHNGTVAEIPGYNTDIIGDLAENFVRTSASGTEPWFMFLAPYGPHAPFTPQPQYANAPVPASNGTRGTRETDLSDKPAWVRNRGATWDSIGKAAREAQFRTLPSIDDMVERVMTTMAEVGEENTIAVFLSDNGYLWGEHGWFRKGVPYTEAIKVPFYVRWPGRPDVVPPGTVDRRIVANIDLVPTVLDAVGLPAGDRDGRSLFDRTSQRDRMLLEYWCNKSDCKRWASTRTKQYQYVEHYDADGNVRFREYYDLEADPSQLSNIVRDGKRTNNPPIAPLSAQLQADRRCVGSACP